MAISINPSTFVITIPKADMLLVQSTPIEIRELNIDNFRLELKSWEDSSAGITMQKTHDHNTSVTISGVQLARVVEILEPYTITFENGSYAVNLVGANSNIADRVNLNTVSVRAANSAGLIQTREIEYASFDGGVTVDVNSGNSGTDYPFGTPAYPVDNLTDAVFIANLRGFVNLYINESMTLDSGTDISGFYIIGRSQVNTELVMDPSADCENITIRSCNISGTLDGGTHIEECNIGDINYVNGHIRDSGLFGTIELDGNKDAVIANCYSIDQDSTPVVDMGGTGQDLAMPNFSGIITIENFSDATGEIGVGLNSGMVILDSTITAGSAIISGVGILTDNSTGTASVNTDGLMSKDTIANLVGVIRSDYAQSSTSNSITLDTGASSINGAYDPAQVSIIEGTGVGQTRLIYEYNGTTKTAYVDRNWKVNPDTTSKFSIIGHPGREHVNEGLSQGGTSTTITLNTNASDEDDAYNGQIVFLRSGAGEDQVRRIIDYDGSTKVATIQEAWSVNPDTTTVYVMLPSRTLISEIADAVWEEASADHTTSTTMGGKLNTASSGGVDYDALGAAVWDRPASSHTTVGTFGDKVGSKLLTLAKWLGLK